MAGSNSSSHRLLRARSLSPLALAFTVFCCVSGGPIGLEPLVAETGPLLALLLILVTPLVWAIPDALTSCELAPAIPVEGGYVVWVRRAMGPFAGFLNAWWTWLYTIVDAALYPVLFTSTLGHLLNYYFGNSILLDNELAHYAVSVCVVILFTYLNIRGTRIVGMASTAFALLIIAPFAVMSIVGLVRMALESKPFLPPGEIAPGELKQGLSAGLGIIMWNYLGWDALSTVAEEVDQPQRAYPRALLWGVPLVAAVYFFPTLVGVHYYPDAAQWQEGAWPNIARAIGGGVDGVGRDRRFHRLSCRPVYGLSSCEFTSSVRSRRREVPSPSARGHSPEVRHTVACDPRLRGALRDPRLPEVREPHSTERRHVLGCSLPRDRSASCVARERAESPQAL
ncbi:MAG: APC family permease [Armatimonadetes bacterium]|nr:APC family permease [Armatimonadota bacterium]NOG93380.1 APC family permease [Armatimonadota bacterium]